MAALYYIKGRGLKRLSLKAMSISAQRQDLGLFLSLGSLSFYTGSKMVIKPTSSFSKWSGLAVVWIKKAIHKQVLLDVSNWGPQ